MQERNGRKNSSPKRGNNRDQPSYLNMRVKELVKTIQKGGGNEAEQAREQLVEVFRKSIGEEAQPYLFLGLSKGALFNSGVLGLLYAADRHGREKKKVAPFCNYARDYIRAEIFKTLRLRSPLSFSRRVYESSGKVSQAEEAYFKANGRLPSNEEIALSIKKPLTIVREAREFLRDVVSLDQVRGSQDGDGEPWLETIADADSAFANLLRERESEAEREKKRALVLHKCIKKLKPHHRVVLELRYYRQKNRTYREIGKIERIKEGTVKSRLSRAKNELKN